MRWYVHFIAPYHRTRGDRRTHVPSANGPAPSPRQVGRSASPDEAPCTSATQRHTKAHRGTQRDTEPHSCEARANAPRHCDDPPIHCRPPDPMACDIAFRPHAGHRTEPWPHRPRRLTRPSHSAAPSPMPATRKRPQGRRRTAAQHRRNRAQIQHRCVKPGRSAEAPRAGLSAGRPHNAGRARDHARQAGGTPTKRPSASPHATLLSRKSRIADHEDESRKRSSASSVSG